MSYHEKKTLVSMGMGLLVIAGYCIYAFGKYQAGGVAPDDLKFWAVTMLVFIGIGILGTIVIQILFHIVLAISVAIVKRSGDESKIKSAIDAAMVEDEMDKLIELKTSKAGFVFAGIGFVAGIVSLALNFPPFVMLNILFLSFFCGSLAEGILSMYFYRNGVKHG